MDSDRMVARAAGDLSCWRHITVCAVVQANIPEPARAQVRTQMAGGGGSELCVVD